MATLAGGAAGFATAKDAATLSLPLAVLDDPPGAAGEGVATLFLIPGIGETLRVNGRVKAVTGEALEIAVDECLVHCAKALIRSDFWSAEPVRAPVDAEAFLAAASFLALGTADADGRADLSPKGDPAGGLVRWQDGGATMAERPGNRLGFGFRNILTQPAVAAVALVPGSATVAILTGDATLSDDEAVRGAFVVEGKTPILVTRISKASVALRESRALVAAKVWPAAAHPASQVDPAAVLVAHVKANKSKDEAAAAVRSFVERDLVAKGLTDSYRETLY